MCAKGPQSLGTTHCSSATIKYREYGKVRVGLIRGCIDCAGNYGKKDNELMIKSDGSVQMAIKQGSYFIACSSSENMSTTKPNWSF